VESCRRTPVAGCIETKSGADGTYSLEVEGGATYWVWAFAEGCEVHAAVGATVKEVRAGGTVDFDASDAQDLQRTAGDPSRPETQRVQVLASLRGMPGGRSTAVVAAMIDLLRTSQSPQVRQDVIMHLHGCKDPALARVLADLLRSDPDENVRARAA